jgi:hypothetical protein
MEANSMLMYEKEMAKQATLDAKVYEGMNYFPFTHGDTIDRQRKVL